MASEGGGKVKNKRGHSSSKPYERRKSLFRRITDSIKDVLRPSWLANDNDDVPAVPEVAGTSVADDGEECVVIPGQSPQQLPGLGGPGLRTAGDPPTQQRPDTSDVPADATMQWQQGFQASPGWERPIQTRVSTWGNSAAAFDKAQFTRGYFAPKASGTRQGESTLEMPSRGLGGPPPGIPPTSTASSRMRVLLSNSGKSSPSDGPCLQQDDSLVTGAALSMSESSPSPDNPDDNPSKRQRLWSPEMSRKGRLLQPAVHNKPSFKASVFCSPSLNDSLHESSFYSGKTTYGGASAYSRKSLNSSLPYQNSLPIRKSVTAKPLNNSGNAVLSSSATQILKTLERLSDAKRSRVNETETESLLSFTPSSYRKPSRPLQTSLPSRSLELRLRGPPISRLQSPMAASIARNRQIVSVPARSSRPPAATATCSSRDEDDDNVSDDDVQVIGEQQQLDGVRERQRGEGMPGNSGWAEAPSSRSSGKMKHPKTYDRRQKPVREEDEVVEVPNLRTDFTLPICSMPGFTLGLPTSSAAAAPPPSSASAASKSSTLMTTCVGSSMTMAEHGSSSFPSSQSPPKMQFTFSSPIYKSRPEASGTSPPSSADFQFSSPLKLTTSVPAGSEGTPVTTGFGSANSHQFTPPSWGSTAPKPKSTVTGNAQPSPPVTSGFGSTKSMSSPMNQGVSGTGPMAVATTSASEDPFKPASQLRSGSVMDVLGGAGGKSPETSSASLSMKPAAQLKQGSVMDILGGRSSAQPISSASGSDRLFAKFAAPSGSWECGSCMVQNKPEATKCVACEAAKPGAKPKAASGSSGSDSLFAKFAAPSGSWECESCMVQNKPEATKCVACEAAKPGARLKAGSGPSVSSSDSLFAKFAAPSGSWECEACMLQNKPEATKCVACDTAKRGAAKTPSSAPQVDIMAKFRRPAGSWECDVCMVQNTAEHTKCLACESPRPGTQSTGSVPPQSLSSGPAPGAVGPGGGLILTATSTSSGPSPFLAAAGTTTTGPTTTSSTGFKFGAPSSSSAPSFPATGGFKFGTTPTSGAKDSPGFKFGNQDTSNSNSASSTTPASACFQFGAKDSTDSKDTAVSKASGFKIGSGTDSQAPSSAASGSGFQFGAPPAGCAPSASGGSMFDKTTTLSPGLAATTASSTFPAAPGFSFGSSASTGGITIGSPIQTQNKDSEVKNVDRLTSAQTTCTEGSGMGATSGFSPVFGASKPSNNFALGAAPSLASGGTSLISGGFTFGSPASSGSSTPSAFSSGQILRATMPGSDSSKPENGGSGAKPAPSIPVSFSFGAATKPNDTVPKPGLFTSALADSSISKPNSSGASSSTSQGFVFGASGTTSSSATSPFSSVPQLGTGGFGGAPALSAGPAKPAVNGELGAPGVFAFGQQSSGGSSTAAAGFSFGIAAANPKDSASAPNPLGAAKPTFSFGADSGSVGKSSKEKRRLDNDHGPGDAKKQSFNLQGAPSTGEAEPFKFGNPGTAAGSNSLFKFGQTSEGPAEKAPGIAAFGGQASGFGSGMQTGFSFSNAQTNAASSTGIPQGTSLFSAGAGSTNTGQFSFNIGAGSQSNAAAASAFGSDTPATSLPTQGFNFTGATQPTFSFGANSNANTSAPGFHFGNQSADLAPAQSAGPQSAGPGVFMFGQAAPTPDSTAPPPSLPAPTAMGFGAATPQSFNIGSGSGEGTRKIKRAVRRATRKP